jgi:hypothetical protein
MSDDEDIVLSKWCSTDESPVYEEPDPDGPPAMAAQKDLAWPIGAVINVRFLDGDAPINKIIADVAKEWEKYAKLTFNFVDNAVPVQSSDIRITKTAGGPRGGTLVHAWNKSHLER